MAKIRLVVVNVWSVGGPINKLKVAQYTGNQRGKWMRKCVTELKSRKRKFEGGKRLDTRMEDSVS